MKHPIPGNIVLIGFLCSGKSTVGKILAQELSLTFFDIDQFLEKEIGPIPTFIAQFGTAAFRHREYQILFEKMPTEHAVIATGAGTVMPVRTRKRLLADFSRVFFLDAPFHVLYNRMTTLPKHLCRRPDFLEDPKENSKLNMLNEYRRRIPLYQSIGVTVDATPTPRDVAGEITRLLFEQK